MRRVAPAVILVVLLASACVAEPSLGEPVRFTTDDGVQLAGEVRGSGETAVVLAHMFPADRNSWDEFASILADQGYRAMNFDFRGFGGSEGPRDIGRIWRDILAAVEEMERRGAERVVVIGASMGGTAALVAASRVDLEAVITLSAPSTFMGISAPPEVVRAVDEPKLFIAAEGDGQAAQTAQDLYTIASGAKRLEIVTGDEHGTDILEGSQAEVVRRQILDFLESM